VLPRFFPYRGGYENSLLALAKYMVKHGHRVTVFTTVANDLEAFWLPEFRRFAEGQIEVDGVVIRRFPIDYNKLRRRASRFLGAFPYWRWKAKYWRPSFRIPCGATRGIRDVLKSKPERPGIIFGSSDGRSYGEYNVAWRILYDHFRRDGVHKDSAQQYACALSFRLFQA
jgi:hypothetical protein